VLAKQVSKRWVTVKSWFKSRRRERVTV